MSDETSQRIFLVGALWNMFGAGLFFLLWRPAFAFFQLEHPNYPAFFQAWLALAFVFGSGYYYVSRDLYGNLHIVRLGIYGKTAFAMIFIYHVVFSNFHPVFLSGAIIDLVFVGLYARFLAQAGARKAWSRDAHTPTELYREEGSAVVQIDIPIAFAAGQMLADAANRQLRTGKPEHYYRAQAATNLFTGLFFAPIPIYFLVDYFGWETTYMVDPERVTRFFIPIVLFVLMLAANLGFWLSNALIQKGRAGVGRIVYILIWIYSLAWILGNWPRSTRIGTYAEYHTARETMIRVWEASKDPFFYILIATLVIFFVPLLLFLVRLRREGRQPGV